MVLHHKVVASLREDQTRPTAHKVAAARVRNINIRISIPLFRFRVLMTTSFYKVATTWIRGKRLSKPLLLTHCDIGSQGCRYADDRVRVLMATSYHKVAATRIRGNGLAKIWFNALRYSPYCD